MIVVVGGAVDVMGTVVVVGAEVVVVTNNTVKSIRKYTLHRASVFRITPNMYIVKL